MAASAQESQQVAIQTNYRKKLGTLQNRLQRTLGNLEVSIENLSAADSTIRNADLTEEITLLTRNQVLSNTAVSMVEQTNLSEKNLLNLI
ncbi:MAG: flagellin [Nitrospinales bacterium]